MKRKGVNICLVAPIITFFLGLNLSIFLKLIDDILKRINLNVVAIVITICLAFGVPLYKENKKKRSTARQVLQEIKNAMSQIEIIHERGDSFSLSDRLLPTDNWHNNLSLFTNDLNENERKSVSCFYKEAVCIDNMIFRAVNQLFNAPVLSSYSSDDSCDNSNKGIQYSSITSGFELNIRTLLLEEINVIKSIDMISAVDKLEEISVKKWLRFL